MNASSAGTVSSLSVRLIHSAKLLLVVGDEVLVLRTSQTHPQHPGIQDLPGGIIERDETTEDGLVREVREEAGITLDPLEPKLVYTSTINADGKTIYSDHIYALRLQQKPEISISWEHDQFEWLPIQSLTNLGVLYQQGVDFIVGHRLLDII